MDIPKKKDIEKEKFDKVVAEADLISGQIKRAMKSDFKPGGELSVPLPRWPSDEIQTEVLIVSRNLAGQLFSKKPNGWVTSSTKSGDPKMQA